jgi:hypothetical protein
MIWVIQGGIIGECADCLIDRNLPLRARTDEGIWTVCGPWSLSVIGLKQHILIVVLAFLTVLKLLKLVVLNLMFGFSGLHDCSESSFFPFLER